jgi:hypothetical protein
LAAGIISSASAAFAEPVAISENEPTAIIEVAENEAKSVRIDGIIKEIKTDAIVITADEKDTEYALTEASLLYSNNAKAIKAEDLKIGDSVIVYASGSEIKALIRVDEDCMNNASLAVYYTSELFGTVTDEDNNIALNLDENSDVTDIEGNKVDINTLNGRELLVFYGMITMSLPGQTNPEKVIVLSEAKQEEGFEKTDVFNKDEESGMLVSADGTLALNIGENTEIVDKDGNKAEASELDGKELKVTYTTTTRSIPAQTTPSKIVILGEAKQEESFEKTDVFNKDEESGMLVSSDNTLALNIGENTEIVDKDGNKAEASELDGKKLSVTYTTTTRSIPAQTTPSKIVILGEEEPVEIKFVQAGDFAEEIKNNEDGVELIPVRDVCEALGMKVDWAGDTRTVTITDTNAQSFSFVIGQTSYVSLDGESKNEAASVIINDRTYVPAEVFTVFGLNVEKMGESIVIK